MDGWDGWDGWDGMGWDRMGSMECIGGWDLMDGMHGMYGDGWDGWNGMGWMDGWCQVAAILSHVGEYSADDINKLGFWAMKKRRSLNGLRGKKKVLLPGGFQTFKERLIALAVQLTGIGGKDQLPTGGEAMVLFGVFWW